MSESQSNVLILDTGTCTTKVGLAEENFPRLVIPTIIGTNPKDDPLENIQTFGKEALSKKNTKLITNIISNHKIKNYLHLKNFLHEITFNELQIEMNETPTLLNMKNFSNQIHKIKSTEIFFEDFNVPKFYMVSDALLTIYSVGKINGVVIDSGLEKTSIVPIYEGNVLNHAHIEVEYGGKNVTDYLRNAFSLDYFQAEEIKKKYGRVSLFYENEFLELQTSSKILINTQDKEEKSYEKSTILPDGRKIHFKEHLIKSTEGLFRSNIFKSPFPSIQELIYECMLKLDFDYRREILDHLVIGGGNTCFENFDKRIENEMINLFPTILKFKTVSNDDKKNSVFLGGCVMSKLNTFQQHWVTKADYQEYGSVVVFRKFV